MTTHSFRQSRFRRARSSLACALLVALAAGSSIAALADAPAGTDAVSATAAPTEASPAVAPLSADELDATVAPIALYPDALVAQVLSASMFPDQIAVANYWVGGHKSLTGSALAQAVDQQTWDPSVKALTQFPAVLADLATNLAWTSSLGEAFHHQPSDVMAAVQSMRAKAHAAGNLESSAQITVVQQTPQTIVIQPANPKIVYVPQYNPTVIYGSPYVVPYYAPVFPAVAAISFGSGIAMGAWFGGGVAFGGGFHWGFNAWNLNWGGGGGTVIYNHNTYISNTTWHGNRYNYNGYHPWGPGPHGGYPYGPHRYYPDGPRANGGRNVPYRNGGHNGDHGLIGGNGGVDHGPNGGNNGNRGLIGGDHGGEQRNGASGGDRPRSAWSGDGGAARAEYSRGRSSMAGAHFGGRHGGGGRRR